MQKSATEKARVIINKCIPGSKTVKEILNKASRKGVTIQGDYESINFRFNPQEINGDDLIYYLGENGVTVL